MGNPQTLESLKLVGLIPTETSLLTKNDVVGLIGNDKTE
jgi:hypothetical protein